MEQDRRREVIESCLELFISKGLSETSTRDLSRALKLQNAGLYYYFQSKTDAVIACFEGALFQIEIGVLLPFINDIDDLDQAMDNLLSRASELKEYLRFVVEAYVSLSYRDALRPSIDRMRKRIKQYSKKLASKLNCSPAEIEPYMHMMISAVTEFMIFEDKKRIGLQLEIVQSELLRLRKKIDNR